MAEPGTDVILACHPDSTTSAATGPVLTAEVTPRLSLDRWTFTVDGLVGAERTWTYADLQALPGSEYAGDIHCVTTWSKLATSFSGVSLDVLLAQVVIDPKAAVRPGDIDDRLHDQPAAGDVQDGKAWLVWTHEGHPLPTEHGGPIRMLVPALYFWKSAKWITKLTLLEHDKQGFWERNGYHDRGDPWLEQRYQGD